jgi:hypothetical protein
MLTDLFILKALVLQVSSALDQLVITHTHTRTVDASIG